MKKYIIPALGLSAIVAGFFYSKITSSNSTKENQFMTERTKTFQQPDILQENNQNIWYPDETWDSLSLKDKAGYLQPLIERKDTLSLDERKDLSKKMHQYLILVMAHHAKTLIKNVATIAFPNEADRLAQTADLLILVDQLITKILQPEYIKTLKRLRKIAHCIRKKSYQECTEICLNKKQCIGILLQDTATILEPLLSITIGSSKIGNEKILGILPLLFQLAAPETPLGQDLITLSILLDSSIQLLKKTGKIASSSQTQGV